MFGTNGHTSISISTGTMVRAVLIALAVFLIWFLRDLVLVVLTSIVIASFVESAVPHLTKFKINRIFGISLIYVFSLLVLAGLFYLFAPLLITEIYNFSTFISEYVPGVDFLNYFHNDAFGSAKDVVSNLSNDFSISGLFEVSKNFIVNLSGGFFKTLSLAFGSIFNVILIVIISFYFSIQEKGIENFLRIIITPKYEAYAIDLWNRTSRKIALWVKGQMLLGLLVAILTYLALSLMGIKYALLLAIIAGLFDMVPYGILVAVVPAVSFSYLSGGFSSSLLVAIAYSIIHQFEVFLFAPLIIKKVVGLSPLVVILAALMGFELAGFWGLVLAIPMAVFVIELLTDLEKHKSFNKKNDGEETK